MPKKRQNPLETLCQQYVVTHPYAPTNVFTIGIDELQKMKYVEITDKEVIQNYDIIALDKSNSLWAVIENAASFRRNIKSPTKGKFQILRLK